MTSIKLKFKAHANNEKEGSLYFQITHERAVKQVKTDYSIYSQEWDKEKNQIIKKSPISFERNKTLQDIRNKVKWEQRRISSSLKALENSGQFHTSEETVRHYSEAYTNGITVFQYIEQQACRMRELGRIRTSETYIQALNSFRRFRNGTDLYFDMFDANLAGQYEAYLRSNGLKRNTTSFYMRILRCMYNRAAEEGLAAQANPFRRVYTGVDKTAKRAITLKEIKRLKELDLSDRPDLDFSRDIFLFSFYMRGMSFIDLAYLRKCDLSNGYVTYVRKKTGKTLAIRWEKPMQEIVDKYPDNTTQYMLPVITESGSTERNQYLNKITIVNRKLKLVAQLAKIPFPLSMYVARHSWASIALAKNIPVSVISEGMGHDNEKTTRIYLASIQTNIIDAANNLILKDL